MAWWLSPRTKALAAAFVVIGWLAADAPAGHGAADPHQAVTGFRTSDRCIACHNGLTTPSGEDVSIGFDWRASVMANSSRDPYWQAAVRRESIDHPESSARIQDTCATCHMPMARYDAKVHGQLGEVFAHLPFASTDNKSPEAEDGISCSLCHQIGRERLGTPESFTGNFVIDAANGTWPEYGPFPVQPAQQRIMRTSTEGFQPEFADHIRQSELCATCHTLITETLGPGGREVGRFPEQMPYQEWLHSDYPNTQSCQACHMRLVEEPTAIARTFGVPRHGFMRHEFSGGNFFLQRILNRYGGELSVAALPQELARAADRTVEFLGTQAARVSVGEPRLDGGTLSAEVSVENLGGHKLPTAYPSRRAWLHVVVLDRDERVVFESGRVNPDGSIPGNDNDADRTKFEPHYSEIRRGDQVQIYESILRDTAGGVTTGLLNAVGYLKDNRLLPRGFDKATAEADIAVVGDARQDGDFVGGGDRVRYVVDVPADRGPFHVEAELLYQPIGYRWANNLKSYSQAAEPKRFTGYYDAMGPATTTVLARAVR